MTKLSKKKHGPTTGFNRGPKKSFPTPKKIILRPPTRARYIKKNDEIDKKNMVLPLDLIGVQKNVSAPGSKRQFR